MVSRGGKSDLVGHLLVVKLNRFLNRIITRQLFFGSTKVKSMSDFREGDKFFLGVN